MNPPRMQFLCALFAALPFAAAGQIRTDASLGRPAASLAGPSYVISQDLGRLAGRNLFHSFQVFNVGPGESATFTATADLANVISRVTGGEASSIRGPLRLDAPAGTAPAFWFVNPAGVVFGEGATVNVPGAFRVTTANYLKFADGEFHADLAKASTFSTLDPSAFGFLGDSRATVRLHNGAQIRSEAPIEIVAGDVILTNGLIVGGAGDIRVVALGSSSGEIPLTGSITGPNGSIELTDAGLVRTRVIEGRDAGNVEVYGGSLLIDGIRSTSGTGISSIASYFPGGNGGNVSVNIGGPVSILNGGEVATATSGRGNGGSVSLSAESLTIDGGGGSRITGIFSRAIQGSRGDAGNVQVDVRGSVNLVNGASISSDIFGSGNGGRIKVTAGDLTLDGRGLEENASTISSAAQPGSSGSSGDVEVDVRGALVIVEGGTILSSTFSSGAAGRIKVSAGTLLIDGKANEVVVTGISSQAEYDSTGPAGTVEVAVRDALIVIGGGEITSSTFSTGNAGSVIVSTGSLLIDGGNSDTIFTGITSSSNFPGTGAGGSVEITATGTVTILGGGEINADTETSGRAGTVKLAAGRLVIDGTTFDGFTGISSDAVDSTGSAGGVDIRVSGEILILDGAQIASDTFSSGNAGSVRVRAGSITIDNKGNPTFTGITSAAFSGGSGSAGDVVVVADGALRLVNQGLISSSTQTSGNAGTVTATAGSLLIDGEGSSAAAGIFSQAIKGSGNAGNITVNVAGTAEIRNSGLISTDTLTTGNAGTISFSAGSLVVDGHGLAFVSGISSNSRTGAHGSAGNIVVNVGGALSLLNQGQIASDTQSSGHAGAVTVNAGSLLLDGRGTRFFTGISSDTFGQATGSAGNVQVNVQGHAAILNGGDISSSTFTSGEAGTVRVSAASLEIDRQGSPRFTGISSRSDSGAFANAGTVDVDVAGSLSIVNAGAITSDTSAKGNAGTVSVRAGELVVDGSGTTELTAISSRATGAESGDAGGVNIVVDGAMAVLRGGAITSATQSPAGRAGTVDVRAATILVDGTNGSIPSSINAVASVGSSGQTGNVRVAASESITISNLGTISIGNDATVANAGTLTPSTVVVEAPLVQLTNLGSISSVSSGNVAASNISVDAGTLILQNSVINTSVLGTNGNGGNIDVHADALRMETGFITANTAATNASGGIVNIDAGLLIASGSSLFVGGSEPIAFVPGIVGLNVIQAAAPTGVSGTIGLTSPVLDTSGALAGLGAPPLDTSGLSRSPCRVTAGSSLAVLGRGGLAPSARESLRLDPVFSVPKSASTPSRLAMDFSRAPCAHAAF